MVKTVSIVIPTHNRKHTLVKVIESYLCQKHLHELIFIDDGSTDGTFEYLQELARHYSFIKIRRHEKVYGVSASRNEGIDMATGNFILFGEDDVHLSNDYIDALMRCMDESRADIVAGRIFYSRIGETIEYTIRRCYEIRGSLMNYWLMSGNYSIKLSGPQQMPFLHAVSLGKAKVCRQIGFDGVFFAREETDFYLRACEEGFKILFYPYTVCVHLQRDREGGGGWRVGVLKYQYLAIKNNNMLIERHYALLKDWGMKGNKITFKFLHFLNRIRILYLYYRFSLKHSKYRIGFLMHSARNIGGGEKNFFLLIKHLNRDDFEPIVFYAIENKIIRDLKSAGVKVEKLAFSDIVTSVFRDTIQKNPLALFLYTYHLIRSVFLLIKIIKKHELVILHPYDNLSKILGAIAGKCCGVKVVTHCHDQLGQSTIEKMLGIWQIIMMNRIVAVSKCVKNIFLSYLKMAKKKIKIIYNGIDIAQFSPRDSHPRPADGKSEFGSENIVIGIIGLLDKVKGHLLLFEAIKRLKAQNIRRFLCLVIGAGREELALRNYVKENGLNNEVRFLGYRDDIPELLRKIDIVAVPSKREAFGMVAIESMAARVPVVATRVGGLPELIDNDHTGLLVPPGDTESLCMAIRYLIENPGIRKRMGEKGRKKVEKYFKIEDKIRETERLYLEVLRS